MPELPFPDHVRALLAKPNPAVVSDPALRRPAGVGGDLVPARGRRPGAARTWTTPGSASSTCAATPASR